LDFDCSGVRVDRGGGCLVGLDWFAWVISGKHPHESVVFALVREVMPGLLRWW